MLKAFSLICVLNSTNLLQAQDNINLKPIINDSIKLFGEKNTKRNIVFVEPCLSSHLLIVEALKAGYNPIVISANSDKRIVPEEVLKKVAFHFKIDTNNDEQVINFLSQLKQYIHIDAVVPGAEFYVPLTAKIAQELNLPGLEPEVALNARRKDLMREALSKSGVVIPQFKLVKSEQELIAAVKDIGLPCVIKATDLAGSVNVSKAETLSEAVNYFKQIIDNPTQSKEWGGRKLKRQALVEEYVIGKEYSIEGFIKNGHVNVVSITEKLLSCEKDFVEVGHIVGAPIDEQQNVAIRKYVQQVVSALKLNIGPFHAELRMTNKGPILMEIAMRLGGDYIPKLINYAYGVNFLFKYN